MSNKPKARSRLHQSDEKKDATISTSEIKQSPLQKKNASTVKNASSKKIHIPLKKYLRHLPTLLLAIPFYWGVWYILSNVFPSQIKDFFLINTYLPLQIPFFLGNFFFLTFLTLKSRTGFLLSLLMSLFLFFKLQNVSLSLPIVGIIGLPFLILEGMGRKLEKR